MPLTHTPLLCAMPVKGVFVIKYRVVCPLQPNIVVWHVPQRSSHNKLWTLMIKCNVVCPQPSLLCGMCHEVLAKYYRGKFVPLCTPPSFHPLLRRREWSKVRRQKGCGSVCHHLSSPSLWDMALYFWWRLNSLKEYHDNFFVLERRSNIVPCFVLPDFNKKGFQNLLKK